MRQRDFGRTGRRVPVIGQGTWNMERDFRAEAIAALRRGLDAGMTHVDTAELYGWGEVERLVHDALGSHRGEVFLATKVHPAHATYEGTLRACEASLERLGSDCVDLYLLHWPSEHPIERTIAAFERLAEQGKIRFWGLSNFDVGELEHALRIAGEGRIACNQVLYHLGERHIETDLIPFCEQHGIAVVAYSPFGSGEFPSERSSGGRVLQEIAGSHGVSPRAVALAFLTRRESVFTIPKASSVGHVLENARGGELQLGEGDIARIDEAFPVQVRRGLPTL